VYNKEAHQAELMGRTKRKWSFQMAKSVYNKTEWAEYLKQGLDYTSKEKVDYSKSAWDFEDD